MEKLRIVVDGLDLNTTADLIQDLRRNNLEFEFVALDAVHKEDSPYKSIGRKFHGDRRALLVAIIAESPMIHSTQRLAEKAQAEFNDMLIPVMHDFSYREQKQNQYQKQQNQFRARQYRR